MPWDVRTTRAPVLLKTRHPRLVVRSEVPVPEPVPLLLEYRRPPRLVPLTLRPQRPPPELLPRRPELKRPEEPPQLLTERLRQELPQPPQFSELELLVQPEFREPLKHIRLVPPQRLPQPLQEHVTVLKRGNSSIKKQHQRVTCGRGGQTDLFYQRHTICFPRQPAYTHE